MSSACFYDGTPFSLVSSSQIPPHPPKLTSKVSSSRKPFMIHLLQQSYSSTSLPPPPASCAFISSSPTFPRVLFVSLPFPPVRRLCGLAGPMSLSSPHLQLGQRACHRVGATLPINECWCSSHAEWALGTGVASPPQPSVGAEALTVSAPRWYEKEAEEAILARGPAIWIVGYFWPPSGTSEPGKRGEEESADKEGIIGAKKTNQLASHRAEAGRLFSQIGNQAIFNSVFLLLTIPGETYGTCAQLRGSAPGLREAGGFKPGATRHTDPLDRSIGLTAGPLEARAPGPATALEGPRTTCRCRPCSLQGTSNSGTSIIGACAAHSVLASPRTCGIRTSTFSRVPVRPELPPGAGLCQAVSPAGCQSCACWPCDSDRAGRPRPLLAAPSDSNEMTKAHNSPSHTRPAPDTLLSPGGGSVIVSVSLAS